MTECKDAQLTSLTEIIEAALELAEQGLDGMPERRAVSVMNSLELARWWASQAERTTPLPVGLLSDAQALSKPPSDSLSDELEMLFSVTQIVAYYYQRQKWATQDQREALSYCVLHTGNALGMVQGTANRQ